MPSLLHHRAVLTVVTSWLAACASPPINDAGLAAEESLSLLQLHARHSPKVQEEIIAEDEQSAELASSVRPRVVFVAGLEGSGHHLLDSAWRKMLADDGSGFSLSSLGFAQPKPPTSWACQKEWLRPDIDRQKAVFQWARDCQNGIGTGSYCSAARDANAFILSESCLPYPCGNKTLQERRDNFLPRVDWIAEAAESEDVDLRVLLLQRPLDELLLVNCKHRASEECHREKDILVGNAMLLSEQIRQVRARLGPTAVRCVDYCDLPESVAALDVVRSRHVSLAVRVRQPSSCAVPVVSPRPLWAENAERALWEACEAPVSELWGNVQRNQALVDVLGSRVMALESF